MENNTDTQRNTFRSSGQNRRTGKGNSGGKRSTGRKRRKKKASWRDVAKWKYVLTGFEAVLLIFFSIITYYYVWYKVDENGFIKEMSQSYFVRELISGKYQDNFENNVQDQNFDKDKIETNENLVEDKETYYNIALFGIDSRDSTFDDAVHSDTIMIVSINNKTGEVKMASVYRDTMLKMKNSKNEDIYTKANFAFFAGGVENALSMMNVNLDMNITDYAIVNFTGLTKIIDALGGIDVNITPEEQFYINGYLVETREITGLDAPDVDHDGQVHLSGLQATAYCRIRYVQFTDEDGTKYNYDMGRTARQRSVIRKIVAKAKDAGVSQVMEIADSIMNYNTVDEKILTTSLSFDEVMDLIPTMLDFQLTESTGFPFTCDTPTIKGASMVVANGLSYNVEKLHQFLFEDVPYTPSAQVQQISDYLESYTGCPTIKLKEDEEPERSTGGTNKKDDDNDNNDDNDDNADDDN